VIDLIQKTVEPTLSGGESPVNSLVGKPATQFISSVRKAMARRSRIKNTFDIETGRSFTHLRSDGWARRCRGLATSAACALVVAFLLGLGSAHGWAEQKNSQAPPKSQPQPPPQKGQPEQPPKQEQPPKPQASKDQMKGLDEQIQEIKTDVLSMTAELSRLEEKLLYPSGTQVAIFVALSKGDTMRLDAVRLKIDGQLAAHYIYSFKELEALRKGGVQRIYVGNVATGDHQLEVVVDGKLESGADFSRTEHLAFRKEVKPKLVGLTLASSGNNPIALGEW